MVEQVHQKEDRDSERFSILVADDDEFLLDVIEEFLIQNGYVPILATDGLEAVEAFKEKRPDLVLLDANMPGLDGFHACRQIRTLPGSRQTPIVMVTARSDNASVDLAFEAGAEDYVTKPIHWAVLRQRLRLLLERKQALEKIHYQATHDTLTTLPNRTLFMDRLESAIHVCRRNQTVFALMFIDLDRFKWVNDNLGHEAGDQLLCEVAKRITQCVRQSDTVARLGGDEFTVIVTDPAGVKDPSPVIKKILEKLHSPFRLSGQDAFISGSIGISLYPADGQDSATLLGHADNAMYQAKNHGRNGYWFHDISMNPEGLKTEPVSATLNPD